MLGKSVIITTVSVCVMYCDQFSFSFFFSYNIEQEQQLSTETTVLVESYTVSKFTTLVIENETCPLNVFFV